MNAARERLAKVPTLPQTLPRSVLAAACSGRLTEDWRGWQFDLQPANKLLDELATKRRTRNWRKARSSGQTIDFDDYDTLPNGWLWAEVELLLSEPPCNGTSPPGQILPPVSHP